MSKILRGFKYIADKRTRLLILGSFPSAASLRQEGYYAHPRNHFWRLMSDILGADLTMMSYGEKIDSLKARGVGVWDVISSCRRQGSSDTAIKDEKLNDFSGLLKKYPGIELIILNGGKAAGIFNKYADVNICVRQVPSSSPANAISYEVKKRKWKLALQPEKYLE